jgi:hypothetical protein
MSANPSLIDSRQDLLGQQVGINSVVVIRIGGGNLDSAPADGKQLVFPLHSGRWPRSLHGAAVGPGADSRSRESLVGVARWGRAIKRRSALAPPRSVSGW